MYLYDGSCLVNKFYLSGKNDLYRRGGVMDRVIALGRKQEGRKSQT